MLNGNFGFLHDKLDIKILLLFILRRLPDPATFETLLDLTMCNAGISYFDFAECIAELVKTGHIRHEDEAYSITEKGKKNIAVTEISLPVSVRQRAEQSTSDYRTEVSRSSLIKTSHEPDESGGFAVMLALSDGIGDVVSMELFAANERQALDLERGFRKRAEGIYSILIEAILEDKSPKY